MIIDNNNNKKRYNNLMFSNKTDVLNINTNKYIIYKYNFANWKS